jgi:hypothetical protein
MWEANVKINCGRNSLNLSSSFWMMMFIRLDWLKLVCKQINIPEQYAKSVFGRKEERKW